jgi:membrane peptidoglycan carboxypeptidase
MSIRVIVFFATSFVLASESIFHWLLPIPAVKTRDGSIPGKVVVYVDGLEQPLCQRGMNHKDMSLPDFSPYLKQAVIASEDSRFDWHLGADLIATVGAAAKLYIQKDETRGGASTISQQVARTVYGIRTGGDQGWGEKAQEFFYSHILEMFYNKDEILKTYLNRVYLGHLEKVNTGFEAASQSYFGKSAIFLDIQESASLVSILPSPNNYKYYGNNFSAKNEKGQDIFKSERVSERRNAVIDKMAYLGFIDANAKNNARGSALNIFNKIVLPEYSQNSKLVSSHFCDYIITDELRNYYSDKISSNQSLIIESTLDINAQKEAELSLLKFMNIKGERLGYSQASLLTLKLSSGEITSMAGGTGGINRVTQSYLQPGSTFKIFTYIAALNQSIPLDMKFSCKPLVWHTPPQPCQHSEIEAPLSLKDGLIRSENVISLRLAKKIGLKKVVDVADILGIKFRDVLLPENKKKLGDIVQEIDKKYMQKLSELTSDPQGLRFKQEKNKIDTDYINEIDKERNKLETAYTNLDENLLHSGLVIGQTEIRLFDITPVYSTIGNNGIYNKPRGIRKIRDARQCNNFRIIDTCKELYNSKNKSQNPNSSERKIDRGIANTLDSVLMDIVSIGTGKNAYIEGEKSAGKTGTTNEGKDLWFIGYNQNRCLTTGIWIGNDQNDEQLKTKGDSRLASEIWKSYVKKLPNKVYC